MSFRAFVILGVMRSGSNLLEETLGTLNGVAVHGELFNRHFIGGPNRGGAAFGLSKTDRDRDPLQLLTRLVEADGLNGFRLFADHDPRVLAPVLADPSIAKIVLTRRPIDSFVSLAVARETGQWWLGQSKTARTAKVEFDAAAYHAYCEETGAFYTHVRRALQANGQGGFWLDYPDLRQADVLAGLAQYLGLAQTPDPDRVKALVQNPKPLAELLLNPEAADAALAGAVDLFAPRSAEPGRGPGVRGFVATDSGLLYMPIPGAAPDPVARGLTGQRDMTQKDLRRWMRQTHRHRAVTVLRDPLARAHDAFCHAILPLDGPIPDIRAHLVSDFDLRLPDLPSDPGYGAEDHQRAFAGFLEFLTRNLAGQSNLPVHRHWGSQHVFVAAMAGLRPPDLILRDRDLAQSRPDLPELGQIGTWPEATPHDLAAIATARHRELAFRAYRKDYLTFGLGD